MPPEQKNGTENYSGGSTTLPTEPSKGAQLQVGSTLELTAEAPLADPAPIKLPQELIDQIIDNFSSNLDLKSSSLVSKAWTPRSQQKIFSHIILAPADVRLWLSRTEETAAAITPWITKFELRGNPGKKLGTMPWDNPSILTRLIASLASSPIQHLTIIPFHMGRFQKSSLIRCFEPIADSLCSLELRFIKTCASALTFLISMFPNLDDIFLERVNSTPMIWTRGGYDSEYIPSFSGTLEYLDLYDGTRPAFLSWIMGYPLWFHTISPGMLTREDVPVFTELVTMCAPTLQEIPHVMFQAGVTSEHVLGILNPCTNLRKVGIYGGRFDHISPVAETMLLSLRSRHISVIYVEIVETLLTLQVDTVWNDRGWQQLEDFLCKLIEDREDNGEPLVLELGIWRNPQLESGPLDRGTILPRFRKKGLIKFAAPPEDPDFASSLNVKYSDWGIAVGLPMMMSGLFAGGI